MMPRRQLVGYADRAKTIRAGGARDPEVNYSQSVAVRVSHQVVAYVESHQSRTKFVRPAAKQRKYYNEERPHGAIGQKTPISLLNHVGATSPPS
jgi:hypothetical protein